MRLIKNLFVTVVFVLSTLPASLALAQEKDDESTFEGWDTEGEQEGEKKAEDKTGTSEKATAGDQESGSESAAGVSTSAPAAPAVDTSPPPRKTEAGSGANAPGEHPGLLPAVRHEYGSLELKGLFQTLFESTMINDDDDSTESVGFTFQRARFILKGHLLTENLTYFFQGDARNMASFALDMAVKYKYRSFSVKAGRFLPDYTYMMPRNKGKLAAINLPLIVTAGFGVWRQIGAEFAYGEDDQFMLKLGVFNGLMYEPGAINPQLVNNQMGTIFDPATMRSYTNYTDNNKCKDFLVRAAYRPMDSLSIDLNLWLGMPNNFNGDEDNDFVIMGGPGVEYNDGKLHLISEFMFRSVVYGDDTDTATALGLWAHGGYMLLDWVEAMLRVEWIEPDIDNDDDDWVRLSTGAHFFIEEDHFRILANLYADIPTGNGNEIFGILVQAALMW